MPGDEGISASIEYYYLVQSGSEDALNKPGYSITDLGGGSIVQSHIRTASQNMTNEKQLNLDTNKRHALINISSSISWALKLQVMAIIDRGET